RTGVSPVALRLWRGDLGDPLHHYRRAKPPAIRLLAEEAGAMRGLLRGWTFGHLLLLIGALIMLFPMVWMFFGVFKTEQEMFDYPPQLLPKEFTLEVLEYMWSQRNFSQMFLNSSIVA